MEFLATDRKITGARNRTLLPAFKDLKRRRMRNRNQHKKIKKVRHQ